MTQSPKQKAAEIFTHYHNLIQELGGELGQEVLVSIMARQCALYAVGLVVKEYNIHGLTDYNYWLEVERLLEKM
jgi:hypothetical protein